MLLWITDLVSHQGVPAIGDWRDLRIENCPQLRNNRGQGITEILVLAPSKAMSRHDDMASKDVILRVNLGQSMALVRREDAFEKCAPLSVKLPRDALPVEGLDMGDSICCRDCVAY